MRLYGHDNRSGGVRMPRDALGSQDQVLVAQHAELGPVRAAFELGHGYNTRVERGRLAPSSQADTEGAARAGAIDGALVPSTK